MDSISDILGSVSTPSIAARTQDLHALTRAWVTERVAPELLPYPGALMARTLARVRAQIEAVEEQAARGAEGPRGRGASEAFRLVVVQTELERVKFLVRGFLRARIAKIDAHPLHVLLTHTGLLSPSELHYARHHQSLLAAHYSASFLASFPPQLQRLDDAAAGGVSMVSAPDLDTAVFCRVLRDVGEVLVEGTDAAFEMRRGDVYVVRWSVIREAVLNGDVELI